MSLPSAQNAKPVNVDDKGVVTFDNGVKHFPDGHIEQTTSDGSRWFKSNAYAKMVRLPGKDPNQILVEKAAAKGIKFANPSQPTDEELQSAKTALGGTSEEDAQAIADGVQQGNVPPTLQGLYRMRGRVGSILQQRGYNLTNAALDYNAAQRNIASQNSPTFLKQRASLDFTESALNKVDELADQWKAGGFKLLNHARLIAAQNGALGPEAAKIATQLSGQINDMVASTSQVYMGGGTPTDQAMKIASSNLSGDWSEPVLHAMTQQLRDNIQIRRNSLNHLPTIGPQGPVQQLSQPQQSATSPTPAPQAQQNNDQAAMQFVQQHSIPTDPLFKKAQDVAAVLKSKQQNAGQQQPVVASQ